MALVGPRDALVRRPLGAGRVVLDPYAARSVSRAWIDNGLVGHALQIRTKFHRRHDAAKVGCDRLKTQEEIDALLVDLLLELIDFLVVGDRGRAEIVVALLQSIERILEAARR